MSPQFGTAPALLDPSGDQPLIGVGGDAQVHNGPRPDPVFLAFAPACAEGESGDFGQQVGAGAAGSLLPAQPTWRQRPNTRACGARIANLSGPPGRCLPSPAWKPEAWVNRLQVTRRARHLGKAVTDGDEDVPAIGAETIGAAVHLMSQLTTWP